MKYKIITAAFILSLVSAIFLVKQSAANTGYEVIATPQKTANSEKIEVVEVFWYGCPHCDTFEPYIREWTASKPGYVEFERQPGVFSNPVWQLHAAAFYSAEQLGIGEEVHGPIFDTIHRQGNRLDSAEKLQAFFAHYGVDAEQFSATLNSDAVRTRVLRAQQLSQQYGINGVPAMIVNGKYLINGSMAGSYSRMLAIVDHLAALEANNTSADNNE